MKLTSIQLLRGVAAFMVMMSHLLAIEGEMIVASGGSERSFVAPFWENGFAGVDLFFVISGFIMVYVTAGRERGLTSSADFLLARVSRIYPLWWLFLVLAMIALVATTGSIVDAEQFAASGNSLEEYVARSALLLPQGGFPVLGVGWTLIHEMYFYVVFAAFLFLPEKWLPALLGAWAIFVVGCDLAGWTNYNATNLFELANYPMTLEFIAGAVVGLLVLSGRRAFALGLTIIAAAVFAVAVIVFTHDRPEYTLRWGRIIWFGVPAVILVYGITSLEARGGLNLSALPGVVRGALSRIWKWLVALGDVSFALYLSHLLSINAVRRLFEWAADMLDQAGADAAVSNLFRVGSPGLMDNLLFVLTSIIVSMLIALVSYQLFERPSLAVLARWRRSIMPPVKMPERGSIVRETIW